MRTIIYYFSGTGNTLAVAKQIAVKTNADLVFIPRVVCRSKLAIDAERIGIIFPSYLAALSGVPLVVERFVRAIDNITDLNIFAVCNCGGYPSVNAWPSLNRLKKIIESCSGRLHAMYALRLPMNNLDYDHIPIPINKDSQDIIRKSHTQVNQIISCLEKNSKTKPLVLKRLGINLMLLLYQFMRPAVIYKLKIMAREPADSPLVYDQLMPLTDKSIIVNDKCTGCGICLRICSVNNIKIVNNRPHFLHRCEICFACDEWCPANAIHHWSRGKDVKYHHPDVSLDDMLSR